MANFSLRLWQVYQTYLDKTIVHSKFRWVFFFSSLLLFFIRIITVQGYFVVTYALSIFLLNLFLRFITPIKSDLEDEDCDAPVLPIREKDEYKPMLRKLGEFKFWKTGIQAILISFLCTLVEALNFPVFWPVLVMYFIILFAVTMKRQIGHMIKHGYLPVDYGKVRYSNKN